MPEFQQTLLADRLFQNDFVNFDKKIWMSKFTSSKVILHTFQILFDICFFFCYYFFLSKLPYKGLNYIRRQILKNKLTMSCITEYHVSSVLLCE